MLYGDTKFAVIDPPLPSTPSSRGLGRRGPACFGKQRRTQKSTGKNVEDVTPRPGRAGGILGNPPTTRDIGDGLSSDSPSHPCSATVVMDTGRIWNDQEVTRQSLQATMDPCGILRSIAARSPNEYSRSSPRVASRFFSKCVPGFSLHEDRSAPRTPTLDWEDPPNREPEVLALGGYLDSPCPGVAWDGSSNWGTDSFLGDYCGVPLFPLAGTCNLAIGGGGSNYT